MSYTYIIRRCHWALDAEVGSPLVRVMWQIDSVIA